MSVTVTSTPGDYSFAGNQIRFDFESDTPDEFTISIKAGNEDTEYISLFPHGAAAPYKTYIDISGLLKGSFKDPVYPEGVMIGLIQDFAITYQLGINDQVLFTGTAFRGGISDYALAMLYDNEYDIFHYRLQSLFNQFLFTTRTHSDIISLRETELYPFVFIHPGISMQFRSGSGNIIDAGTLPSGSICTMDIQAVLDQFLIRYNEVPTVVDVCPGGERSFSFRIQKSRPAEEKYTIRFLNSLGAYEVIEVTGLAKHAPQMADESLYNKLSDYGFYEERRKRVLSREILQVETGYRSHDQLQFIQDMIKSDEIRFIFPDRSYFRSNVTAENIQFNHRIITPTSIQLNVRMVTDEQFHSPKLDQAMLEYDGGIFDEHEDESFE